LISSPLNICGTAGSVRRHNTNFGAYGRAEQKQQKKQRKEMILQMEICCFRKKM